jgi:hypothetical protein
VPPGTTEASYPALEHEMDGLPGREYFLKTLDRPHYANEKDGNPPGKREPATPPKQQVRNETPIVAAQK